MVGTDNNAFVSFTKFHVFVSLLFGYLFPIAASCNYRNDSRTCLDTSLAFWFLDSFNITNETDFNTYCCARWDFYDCLLLMVKSKCDIIRYEFVQRRMAFVRKRLNKYHCGSYDPDKCHPERMKFVYHCFVIFVCFVSISFSIYKLKEYCKQQVFFQ